MGSDAKWQHITTKTYRFAGEFYPLELYENIKNYLDKKQYDTDETEVEMTALDKKIRIFTHLQSQLEFSRRYYIKLAFSINMSGNVIDPKTKKVNGTLELYVNGLIKKNSLLHEKNPNVVSKFLTKVYDAYFGRDEFGNIIMNCVIEMGKLMAEVKNQLHRR